MALAAGAALLIILLVGVIGLAVVVPLWLTMMAYDIATWRTPIVVPAEVSDTRARIAVERGVARLFVVAGGAFWAIAAFASLYSYREAGLSSASMAAALPLAAVAVTLIVGWYFERVASVLLGVASLAVIAWGVIYQFEVGVWAIVTLALIGPMLTAAVLFWLARRDQEAYEHATSTSPQLSFAFAARSSL